MIKTRITTVILCLILVLTGGFGAKNTFAQEAVWVKVGNIPDNWYKTVDDPLGTWEGEFGESGMIEYTDDGDGDVLQIFFERAPDTVTVPLGDLAASIMKRDLGIVADEYGPTQVPGATAAGYAKAYDSDYGAYDLEVVMVMGIVFMDIYAFFDATPEDENEVIQILQSIEAPGKGLQEPKPTPEPDPEPGPKEPEPTPEPTPAVASEKRQYALEMVAKAESHFLAAVDHDYDSIYNTAVRSKIGTGFLIGQVMEKYNVNLKELREILPSELYERFDYAYDLDKIDSLWKYRKDNKFDEFSEKYIEYAEHKVEEEFAFSEAERRIHRGFEELRDSIKDGEMDKRLNMLAGLLDEVILGIRQVRNGHAESMVASQVAALTITDTMETIETLTRIANKLFDSKLDEVQMVSTLSLVWGQNEVRFWTTRAYLWGGTDLLKDNELERLRERYNLFEREEFYYGPVYIVEDGIEEVLEPWQ